MKLTLKLLCIILIFSIAACTKDPQITNLTKEEILTRKPWITQETYILEANNLTKYERGSSTNTVNYDNEVVTFNSNNTGTFKDIYGATNNFTWSFLDAAKSKLRLIVAYPTGSATINYNMVTLEENNFSGSLNYVTPSGNKVLVSFKRIWQP
jgi:hypothetical protein